MKENWRRYRASKPGRRFQDRYRRQESEHCWQDPRKLFYVVGGLTIALGSLLLGVLPGPGTLTFFVGLGMIAGEFRLVARLLDWAKVRARELGRWVRGRLEIVRRRKGIGRLCGRGLHPSANPASRGDGAYDGRGSSSSTLRTRARALGLRCRQLGSHSSH